MKCALPTNQNTSFDQDIFFNSRKLLSDEARVTENNVDTAENGASEARLPSYPP